MADPELYGLQEEVDALPQLFGFQEESEASPSFFGFQEESEASPALFGFQEETTGGFIPLAITSAIKGKQIAIGADGIATANLVDGILSADAAGRAKVASGFFDQTTVGLKFAANSIADAKLVESYTKADGSRAFSGNQSVGGFKFTNLGAPTAAGDAANKSYVDAVASGLDVKASVRVATTRNLTLDSTTPAYANAGGASARGQITFAAGPSSIDGVALVNGDRILVKNEAGGLGGDANGIWVRTSANTWDRAIDFDQDAEVTAGAFMFVEEGTANADNGWVLTTDNPITIGGASGTVLVFAQFSGAGSIIAGAGLTKTGNTLDVVAANGSIVVGADDIQVGYGAIVAADAGASANGTAVTAARSDHKHQVSTATPSTAVQSDAGTATTGTATSLLRSDAQILASTAAPVAFGTANAQGNSTALARANHVHKRDTPVQESFVPGAPVIQGTPSAYTLSQTPIANASLEFYLNGILLEQGTSAPTKDYDVSGVTVNFHGNVAIDVTDTFIAVYVTQG